MKEPLPASLQPTAEDRARDAELAKEAEAILGEIEGSSGQRVRVNRETYNSVTFGPDGKPIARVRNGVPQQSEAEEAVARAQAATNAELMQIEARINQLTEQRDEITGYDAEGNPRYARAESTRQSLDKQIRQLRLGLTNQKRLNERRWREMAAPAVRRAEERENTAAELAKELEAQGKVTRIRGW